MLRSSLSDLVFNQCIAYRSESCPVFVRFVRHRDARIASLNGMAAIPKRAAA
jgi:hypothetical protein